MNMNELSVKYCMYLKFDFFNIAQFKRNWKKGCLASYKEESILFAGRLQFLICQTLLSKDLLYY